MQKWSPQKVVLFLTLEVALFLTLERLKRGTKTNSPAHIYIYIYIYGRVPCCDPGFCLNADFCWGFIAKISPRRFALFGAKSLVNIPLCVPFSLSCFPSLSLSSSRSPPLPPLYKNLGSQEGKSGFCKIFEKVWPSYWPYSFHVFFVKTWFFFKNLILPAEWRILKKNNKQRWPSYWLMVAKLLTLKVCVFGVHLGLKEEPRNRKQAPGKKTKKKHIFRYIFLGGHFCFKIGGKCQNWQKGWHQMGLMPSTYIYMAVTSVGGQM